MQLDFITTKSNVLCNPNYHHCCHHYLMVHELYHCPLELLVQFYFLFLGITKIHVMASRMGSPCCNKCKKTNYITFLAFFLIISFVKSITTIWWLWLVSSTWFFTCLQVFVLFNFLVPYCLQSESHWKISILSFPSAYIQILQLICASI